MGKAANYGLPLGGRWTPAYLVERPDEAVCGAARIGLVVASTSGSKPSRPAFCTPPSAQPVRQAGPHDGAADVRSRPPTYACSPRPRQRAGERGTAPGNSRPRRLCCPCGVFPLPHLGRRCEAARSDVGQPSMLSGGVINPKSQRLETRRRMGLGEDPRTMTATTSCGAPPATATTSSGAPQRWRQHRLGHGERR